jgi:hypothetical protein
MSKRVFNSIQQRPEPQKLKGAAAMGMNIGTSGFEQIVEYRAEMARTVKIQKGGTPPPPSNRGGAGGRVKYPFEGMGINDHFEIPFEPDRTPLATKHSLEGYTRRFLKAHNLRWRFHIVITDDGVAVWRVA